VEPFVQDDQSLDPREVPMISQERREVVGAWGDAAIKATSASAETRSRFGIGHPLGLRWFGPGRMDRAVQSRFSTPRPRDLTAGTTRRERDE
jgi:hypothetical protein